MKWQQQIKKAKTQYSGTCKRCNQFIQRGQGCPLKLPPKGEGLQAKTYCPMRIPEAD